MKNTMKGYRAQLTGLAITTATILISNAAVTTQPSGLNAGDEYRLIFITSTTRDASSTNIADYNNFVSGVANTVPALVGLGTTWTAMVSTPTVAAVTNTGTDWTPAGATGVPIYLVNDSQVAINYDTFWSADVTNHLNPINIDETGATASNTITWSGTSGQPGDWGFSAYPHSPGSETIFSLGGTQPLRGSGNFSTTRFVDDSFSGNNLELHSMYAISGVLTAVPEPSSAMLILAAGAAFGSRRRRS